MQGTRDYDLQGYRRARPGDRPTRAEFPSPES